MENQGNNRICPNCGMFLNDGVCPECGYSTAGTGFENEQTGKMSAGTQTGAQMDGAAAENGAGQMEGGVNVNDGYYQSNGANQSGYYQQGGANVNGGYYQPNSAQNGYYQQGDANVNGGYYQQNGANQSGYYQQGGANVNGGYYQQNGANQNGYYQNPQGQNGYNGYNPNQPPQKSSSKGAVVAAVIGGLLLLILVIALILVVTMGFSYAKDDLPDDRNSVGQGTERDDDQDDYDPFSDEDTNDDQFSDLDDAPYDDDYDPLEFLDDIDWNDESWKEEPYNYDPEDVGEEFYYELCNCIDRSVNYQVNFETFEDSDESRNICMRINYYQLEGDIPNLEDINESLKEAAMYYSNYYNENIDSYEEIFEEYGSGYVVDVDAFVTYNDDEKISIVMNQYYETPVEINKHVISLNIDLEAGIILYNTDFFDVSDEFLEYYRDTCRDQNGSVPALRYFDNDELRTFFEDEADLILYYTPCGFEVGINYETDESYGWVTATLVDCEQYLQSY